MIRSIVLAALFLTSSWAQAYAYAFDHSHQTFNNILQKYVVDKGHSSAVKYKALKKNRKELDTYLNSLSLVSKKDFNSWNKNDQQAFLMNAYNGFTLKLIIDHYPVKSIRKIFVFANPWKEKFFKMFGEKFYLDKIEHEILRKDYVEPRVHFAVNCASVGCPKLGNKAFVGKTLDVQLEENTKQFIGDMSRNKVDLVGKKIQISKIFDWYGEDFEKASGTVSKFVAPYLTNNKSVQEKITSGKFKVDFLDYDWNLNDSK